MAVLPPTLESTIAMVDVGTWMKGTPRMYVAATNPTRSPTTPPPSAIIQVSRLQRCESCETGARVAAARFSVVLPTTGSAR